MLRSIIISSYCQETRGPLTLFKLINNIANKITHVPCACEHCILIVLTSFSLKYSTNFVIISWVPIDQRVGYEPTESGYETS